MPAAILIELAKQSSNTNDPGAPATAQPAEQMQFLQYQLRSR
jgi:hypothetical protein